MEAINLISAENDKILKGLDQWSALALEKLDSIERHLGEALF